MLARQDTSSRLPDAKARKAYMHQVMVCHVCELHMRLAQVSNPFCQQLLALRVPCIQDQQDACQAPVLTTYSKCA